MMLSAGDEIDYTITWLAMEKRPSFPRPPSPGRAPLALLKADTPPGWYFLSLYGAVGDAYEWRDRFDQPVEDLNAYVSDPKVHLYTAIRNGWPAGFFQLDFRTPDICDVAYFGLVPESVGLGLGKWLLQTAIHTAWDGDGVRRVTLNTCSLDHPRALPLYQKMGFVAFDQTKARRVLHKPRAI